VDKLFDSEFRLLEVLWNVETPINSTQLVALCKERLDWNKSTTYTVLRKLCQKGAAKNENAQVTPLLTRTQAIQAQSDELVSRAGGLPLLFTAFLSGRKLTLQEAEELKRLIDESKGGDA